MSFEGRGFRHVLNKFFGNGKSWIARWWRDAVSLHPFQRKDFATDGVKVVVHPLLEMRGSRVHRIPGQAAPRTFPAASSSWKEPQLHSIRAQTTSVSTRVSAATAITESPVTGYATWASTNAGNQGAELDFDNDGVSNGVEYFMSASAGFTANPTLNGSGLKSLFHSQYSMTYLVVPLVPSPP
jgi:hypothetical protein